MDDSDPYDILPLWRVALYGAYAAAFALLGLASLPFVRLAMRLGLSPRTRPIPPDAPTVARSRRPIL
jgi:hypothetical protein